MKNRIVLLQCLILVITAAVPLYVAELKPIDRKNQWSNTILNHSQLDIEQFRVASDQVIGATGVIRS